MTDISHPDTVYEGRQIFPMNGTSMLAWLEGTAENVHPEDQAHGWELFGRRGLRKGDWKLEWMEDPYGNSNWELYNLKEDIAEQHNLAGEQPEKLAELVADWEAYVEANGVIIGSEPTAYGSEDYWREE
jgi:arylsulfatase